MKIAFVGKGGSGKTTTSTLFAQYVSQSLPVVAIDADINMHMAELFGLDHVSSDKLLSEKGPSDELRTWLRGSNARIISNDHFKKSTPPGEGSRLIDVVRDNWMMRRFAQTVNKNLSLVTVGSYSETGIASSCYHNNLAVLENMLSHTLDTGVIVVDMVAGTDAFASTLFAQFDVLIFVAEPTRRSLAVFDQYKQLAEAGGVGDRLFVVGNKFEDVDDAAYVRDSAGDRLLGSLSRSAHLLEVDKGRAALAVEKLDVRDQEVFQAILKTTTRAAISAQDRLPLLWELHKVYVQQPFIVERFGDLTAQIDPNFTYQASESYAKEVL